TPSLLSRVDDQLRIRRDARALVQRTLRQRLHLARRVILDRDREAAAVAFHEHEALAVRRGPRRDVPVALEREPLDAVGGEIEAIDLRGAAAVRREQDVLAVRRELG